ncbi:MAG: hypothetical protein ABI342_04135 [Nitrososphaera sp.]|jgi:hypothetical protein
MSSVELTTITITHETRQKLELSSKQDQDFDAIINKLIILSSDKL